MNLGAFDRDFSLPELLSESERCRIAESISALLGPEARLLDGGGDWVAGAEHGTEGAVRMPLVIELEPIGYLEANADASRVGAAAELLGLMLKSNRRYRMASDLHLETVHEDYAELQRHYKALQASENRYRELAARLEERVAEQVRSIEAAQRQLYQNEKLAAVGQLAAGVAHEINNPLGFIKSNLNTAQEYLQTLSGFAEALNEAADLEAVRGVWRDRDLSFVLEDFAAMLRESHAGVDRVARIVADLKGFSRVDEEGYEWVELSDIVEQVANLSRPRLGGRVKLRLALGNGCRCLCNPAQIGEVLYNLLDNAAKSVTEKAGQIGIAIESDEGGCRVTVVDNGCGMAPAVVKRIFEPFYSTRGVGNGTGLGLTVANDIIRGHGGRIDVTSVPGKGSRFTVHLPRQATPPVGAVQKG